MRNNTIDVTLYYDGLYEYLYSNIDIELVHNE